MDADFEDQIEEESSTRAKASEMEHAMRHHIDVHYDEDPVRYEGLSDKLEEIHERYEGEWEQMYEKLAELKDQLEREPEDPDETGLDPRRELPFYRVLKEELAEGEYEEQYTEALAEQTEALVAMMSREIDKVDFWESPHYQEQLQKKVAQRLYEEDELDLEIGEAQGLADRLVHLARENEQRLKAR